MCVDRESCFRASALVREAMMTVENAKILASNDQLHLKVPPSQFSASCFVSSHQIQTLVDFFASQRILQL